MEMERFDWNSWQLLNQVVISFTGGKGGTGKSTAAINIAYLFSKMGKKVLIVDCDVDNPNISILLGAELKPIKEVINFIPIFNDNCKFCKKCHDVCRARAILHIPNKKPLLFSEICTGCTACQIICPENAIDSGSKTIGEIYEGSNHGIDIIAGKLKVGEPNSADVVKQTKVYAFNKLNNHNYDIVIIDTAPGAHCDVFYAIYGSKYVLYITEPTLYGMYDLKRIIKLVQVNDYPIKSYIILNRSDMTNRNDLISNISNEFSIPLLGKIPLDRDIQIAYARGNPVIKEFPESISTLAYNKIFEKFLDELK
ncbi:MAG: nucleotide-binding protein [Candidatus Helarchaeota archaeon]